MVLILILLVPSYLRNYGQDDRISIRFDSILFSQFIDTVESIVPVKIFYSDTWTDSLTLSVNSANSTFNQLMDKTLRKNGFSFFITEDNRVILTKGYAVKTNFREMYLDHLARVSIETEAAGQLQAPSPEAEASISDEVRLFRIGRRISGLEGGVSVLSGNVTNIIDGSFISGVIVYVEKLRIGVMTNDAGYYSLSLPAGQYQIDFRMIGMKSTRRNAMIYSSGTLDVAMEESTSEMEAVVITGSRSSVRDVRTGIEKINIRMLKQIPMGLGEADVLKSSLLLPGVQTVGEASSGFNVRGGSTDQNLVFLNNAPVINPSHFFGFFSAFNSDMVSDVVLYKSGMPAKYGGRLSSVLEIIPAEGNSEKVRVSGGISPMTGRIMAEGPLKNTNTTFIAGARATYSDWILGLLRDYRLKNSSAGFYDLQGSVKTEIDENNTLTLSAYLSNDKFDYFRERAFDYGNLASTLKWNHTFSKQFSLQMFAILSNYRYRLDTKDDSTLSGTMNYKLNQNILRAEFLYYHSVKHKIEFGTDAAYYTLMPGKISPSGIYSTVPPKTIQDERALEPSLYLSDEYEVTPLLSLSAGLRTTLFTAFGPRQVFHYVEGLPLSESTISDTVFYRKGEVMKVYPRLEYRFSSRLIIAPQLSVKMGAQRVYQYIHMISNTTSISPTDTWKLSDQYIKPQRSDQVSLALYHTAGRKAVETSLEAYYKSLRNVLDYKGGASLLMNEHLETDVIRADGKAYGIEFMIKKQAGMLTGWMSYAYSRTFLKVNGKFDVEKVNDGKYFPADYDKPHDLKIVLNSRFSRRFNMTCNFVYNTGRPVTYPVAFYWYDDMHQVYFSDRNEYRIPDYMRLDLAATFNGNLKAVKLNHSSMTFTVYNVLGRSNPYSVFFRTEDGIIRGYEMSIFGRPLFVFSYNFRIRGNARNDF